MKKKIFITGFEAFGEHKFNPSAEWVTKMKSQRFSNREVLGAILPVTFNGAFEAFKNCFDDFKPDIVILTGLAQNRDVLTIERIGINWLDARIPDNNGEKPIARKINEEGEDGFFTTIPLQKMQLILSQNGLDFKISTSAGEYVCNDLLYKALQYTRETKTQVTFIHLPGLNNHEDYQSIYTGLLKIVEGL